MNRPFAKFFFTFILQIMQRLMLNIRISNNHGMAMVLTVKYEVNEAPYHGRYKNMDGQSQDRHTFNVTLSAPPLAEPGQGQRSNLPHLRDQLTVGPDCQ